MHSAIVVQLREQQLLGTDVGLAEGASLLAGVPPTRRLYGRTAEPYPESSRSDSSRTNALLSV